MITLPQLNAEIISYIDSYENTAEAIGHLYRAFEQGTNSIPALKQHRDHIEANDLGYGDRAFHYMWHLLVQQMPDDFKFLEIGVYKGQVISLISLLAQLQDKRANIVGLSPLSSAGDRFSDHGDADYLKIIQDLFAAFELSTDNLTLIHGMSQSKASYAEALKLGPYNLVYIDGCHELEAVLGDITIYADLLEIGGFLIIDDASTILNVPKGIFRGLHDVSVAASALLDDNPKFAQVFACGHNRVWQKIEDTSSGVFTS